MPSGFKTLASDYLSVMQNLNSSQNKGKMAAMLNPSYNQTDLFTWEGSKLTFASDPTALYEDPFQILSSGDGICVQWSIVYVSACLRLATRAGWSWLLTRQAGPSYMLGQKTTIMEAGFMLIPSDKVWNNPSGT